MLTGLVHRAFPLVGAAGHSSFGGSEPALALSEVSARKRDDYYQRRQTAYVLQHVPRMLKTTGSCQLAVKKSGACRH
jgi:hypothetical protein